MLSLRRFWFSGSLTLEPTFELIFDLATSVSRGPEREKIIRRKLSAPIVLAAICLMLSACAHVETQPPPGAPGGLPLSGTDTEGPPTAADLNDKGTDLKAVPLAVNRQVLKWIDYFQGQGRPHMERYLARSTRYMPVMKKILKENGLPEDLIYIALIESGFSGTAHSSAAAVGYWQFIKGTGKHYGLKIDTYMDERRDFVRSTEAAAAYFKGLYGLFDSWYLAIASYNVGENRVKNVVQKYRTRDFWQLARENKLPLETSDYVPKFIAARLIAKEPEKYGFTDIDYLPPLDYSEVTLSSSVDFRKLATALSLDYDDLRDLNPSYKRGVAFEKNGQLRIRVPKGLEEKTVAAIGEATADQKRAYVAEEDYGYYRIRRGDTIAVIAKKFGTSQRNIRQLNRLALGSTLVAGKRLRVPAEEISGSSHHDDGGDSGSKSSSPEKPPAATPAPEMPTTASQSRQGSHVSIRRGVAAVGKNKRSKAAKFHVVRRGDTLMRIARRYRVSVPDLVRRNKISRRATIKVGTRLEIPELAQ